MNNHMQAQITTIITTVKSMQATCTITAMKNDGKIDADEAKIIKKVNAATEKYIKELQKIK